MLAVFAEPPLREDLAEWVREARSGKAMGGSPSSATIGGGRVGSGVAAGATIDLDVPAGLRARGSAETLTQVVTNLLVNCSRHAAGSPVRVSASEITGSVLVLVRDRGPGIDAGQEHAVLDRGRRSAVTGGRGLGLGISRDLMRARGGDLRIGRPADGPGCLAVLELPVATDQTIRELTG